MKVEILNERGYLEAALGFSLSYSSTIERAAQLFPIYAHKQGGENKFLESIMIWMDITAPRFWWQEADTYRIGSTKQSESTIHTLKNVKATREDFEYDPGTTVLNHINFAITMYRRGDISLSQLKNILPEGFLQRRIWCINYKTLQNIYNQRKDHKLSQWHYFIDEVLKQIKHPEFIREEDKKL
jgi:hypothetical protein